jgi:hypothetical protein
MALSISFVAAGCGRHHYYAVAHEAFSIRFSILDGFFSFFGSIFSFYLFFG